MKLTDEQIKQMVDRFLTWKVPHDFSPDNGISYIPVSWRYQPNADARPTGTNLLTATQAEEMVRYMLAGIED